MLFRTEKRAFTLLELIIVIAIIGLLSMIILNYLSTSRERARDTTIRSNLDNARRQASLYLNVNNSYVDVCTTSKSENGVLEFLNAADQENGIGVVSCAASDTAYALQAQLVATPSEYFCIDSEGMASVSNVALGGATACP